MSTVALTEDTFEDTVDPAGDYPGRLVGVLVRAVPDVRAGLRRRERQA